MSDQRIVFLDFDGVLATPESYKNARTVPDSEFHNGLMLNRTRVQRLETIYRKTKCDVVLSTTWRLLFSFWQNLQWLRDLGYTGPVIGQTKDLPGESRGQEILTWLKDNAPHCTQWIAIDDDWSNMVPITDDHLIKTYWSAPRGKPVGLSSGHVDEAISKLCIKTELSSSTNI